MTQDFLVWGTLLGTVATAVATVFLWRVTRLLAVETTRMADAAAQPQVVASLVPNQWSVIYFDIVVENTGNASAFDINVTFDPPIDTERSGEILPGPLQRISVLKPGESIQSYLNSAEEYLEKSFTVTIDWRRHPTAGQREILTYTLNMVNMKGISFLGERDPLVEISQQIKKIREDWQHIASGFRRIRAETFDVNDRKREDDELRKRFDRKRDPNDPGGDGSS